MGLDEDEEDRMACEATWMGCCLMMDCPHEDVR